MYVPDGQAVHSLFAVEEHCFDILVPGGHEVQAVHASALVTLLYVFDGQFWQTLPDAQLH